MRIEGLITLKRFKFITKYLLIFSLLNAFLSCTNDGEIEIIEEDGNTTVTEEIGVDEEIEVIENEDDEIVDNDNDEIEVTDEEDNEVVDNDDDEIELTEAEELLILVNEFRISEGENPVTLNSALNKAAYDHSNDMNVNDYFSHTGLDGSQFGERAVDAGYTGRAIGENIAAGQRSVQAVFNAWESSDGHRANMLRSSATEMGLGHSGSYWTQIFGLN